MKFLDLLGFINQFHRCEKCSVWRGLSSVLGGILHLDFFGASSHDSHGAHGSLHELGKEIGLNLACADVWVVLSDIFGNFLFEFEFKSNVPNDTEKIPEVVSEVADHALEGVKSSHHGE